MFRLIGLTTLVLLVAGHTIAQESNAAGAAKLYRIDARTPEGLRELFQPTGRPLPFVSAHRGGGALPGYPENCIATFEHTLRHTFAILEIDPRYTQDGQIVIHHDATLDRTTTGSGKVADFTLAELRLLKLKDAAGQVTPYGIPTLDELFAWARGKTVLVLDQKDVPAVERVRQIAKHHAEAYAMVIVSSFADVQACYAANPNVMLEVMIPNVAKAEQFDKLGVPWKNVVPFVGHQPPDDPPLYRFIHERGASCMVGTSRNLDRRFITREVSDLQPLAAGYQQFLSRGADVIETDIPVQLGPLVRGLTEIPEAKRRYLNDP